MTDTHILHTEAELIRLSHAFAYYRDYNDLDQLVALFTPDAVFGVANLSRGHDEIRKNLMQLPADVLVRHVTSNFHFTHVSADEVKGVIYSMSHYGTYSTPGEAPVTFDGRFLLEFHDRYVRTQQGWRIAERIGRPALADPHSPMMHVPKWKPADIF